MPAPAVNPAPIAYIKVVAVKKLVVGFLWSSVVVAFEQDVCYYELLIMSVAVFCP